MEKHVHEQLLINIDFSLKKTTTTTIKNTIHKTTYTPFDICITAIHRHEKVISGKLMCTIHTRTMMVSS